jgi:hypothetical protein
MPALRLRQKLVAREPRTVTPSDPMRMIK